MINNIIKLFSEIFMKNNIGKFYINIDGKKEELNEEHKVRIISLNIEQLNGISNLKNMNFINMSKMFYNCVSLLSIPDIIKLNIQEANDNYLMFYNSISLIFLTNLEKTDEFSENNKNYLGGIILTKYFNINNEITIKNMIVNNNNINFLEKNFIIENEEIVIIPGNKNELIA